MMLFPLLSLQHSSTTRLPLQNPGTHIYSWVERRTVRAESKNTTQWLSLVFNLHLSTQNPTCQLLSQQISWSGVTPGLSDPESSVNTIF